jgi:hypothetical protein
MCIFLHSTHHNHTVSITANFLSPRTSYPPLVVSIYSVSPPVQHFTYRANYHVPSSCVYAPVPGTRSTILPLLGLLLSPQYLAKFQSR